MSKTLLEVLEEVIGRHPALGRQDYLSAAADASEFQAPAFIGLAAGDLVLPGAPVYFAVTSLATITETGQTIAFVTTTTPDTIKSDTASDFDAFKAGEIVTVSGSTDNDGDYTVLAVDTSNVILTVAESLTAEAKTDHSAASVTITATRAWRHVESTPAATSITVEIEPALSGTPGGGGKVQVWHRDLHSIPNVKKCVERALAEITHRWVLVPVTILLDGDMEKAGVTDWSFAGTPATGQKTASAEGKPARQRLAITITTAATDYVYQTIEAVPDEQFAIAALVRTFAVGQTPTVNVYDVSIGADVSLSGDGTDGEQGYAWQVVRNTFTAPSACRQLRIEGKNDTDSSYLFLGWIALTRQAAREVVLPDRVQDIAKVGRVFKAVRQVGDPYEPPGTWQLQEIDDIEKLATRGTGGVVLRFPFALGDGLYFYEEWQGYEALDADSDTTDAAFDLLVEGTALKCYELAYQTWNAGHERRIPQPGAPVRDPNPWLYHLRRQAPKVKALSRSAVGDAKTVVRR